MSRARDAVTTRPARASGRRDAPSLARVTELVKMIGVASRSRARPASDAIASRGRGRARRESATRGPTRGDGAATRARARTATTRRADDARGFDSSTRDDSTRGRWIDSKGYETIRYETMRARDGDDARWRRAGRAAAATTRVGATRTGGAREGRAPDEAARTRRRARRRRSWTSTSEAWRGRWSDEGLRLGERVDQGSFAVVYKATSAGRRAGTEETSWQGAEGDAARR